MTSLTYRAEALGPLRKVAWEIPEGVSVVVGPNRVGKSTLLRLPELIKVAFTSGLNEAVQQVFDGASFLRNFGVPPQTQVRLGVDVIGSDVAPPLTVSWDVDVPVRGGSIAPMPRETVTANGSIVLTRALANPDAESDQVRYTIGTELIPTVGARMLVSGLEDADRPLDAELFSEHMVKVFSDQKSQGSPLRPRIASTGLLAMLTMTALSYRTYHYALAHILRYGSPHSSDLALQSSGENIFPLLRNWRDNSQNEERYEFVLATLRVAFPHIGKIGFEQAGQTVTMTVSDGRWPDRRVPIARESTGVTIALLQLCAVASCNHGGLVTIDELETSLHPRAIRTLIDAFRRRAATHNLRIVLATQSQTVLDQFRDEPEKVFVLEPGQEVSPMRLTDLFSAEYLSQFSLGDLFSHLEFGGDTGDEPSST